MPDIPEALPQPHIVSSRRRLPLVWVIPAIAAAIGIWLALSALDDLHRTISISFETAEGLEANKTRIRYKDVDIGEVKTITLSKDRKRVIVTAQMDKSAQSLLVEDAQFWVVRPRFSGGQLSGLGTLLSGAYISLGTGKSTTHKREFVGQEVAPLLSNDLPGRPFLLKASELGSLDVGSPVYFRQIKVGEVVAYDMEPNGSGVALKIFVHAPYEKFVGTGSRFWNASGIDIALDANGVRLQTQSLTSVLLGGISFETAPNVLIDTPAEANASFTLFKDRAAATHLPDGEPRLFVLHFKESLRGLAAGAPVDFRGAQVGEVRSVGAEYDPAREWFDFPVHIVLYPERIRLMQRNGKQHGTNAEPIQRGLFKAVAERGFRAQLRTGNLLTGQLYIALDFFKEAKPVKLDLNKQPIEFPTIPGNFEELQVSLGRILKNLESVPFADIATDLRATLKTLDQSLKGVDKLVENLDKHVAPELTATLKDLHGTLRNAEKVLAADSPLQQDVRDTLREVSRAAQSLRTLTDMLDRQPEALLKGKQETKP